MASTFNLFDFSSLGGVSSMVKPQVQIPGATGGGLMPPTTTARPLPQTPVDQTYKQPVITGRTDIIKSFYDNPNIPFDDKNLVSDAISKGMDRKEAENYLTTQYSKKDLLVPMKEEQGFLGGAFEKTKGAFTGGLERIQKAGEGLATGEYNPAEAFVRGGAGALQSAFSPISGVLGETIQSGAEKLPQGFKDYIATKTNPTIEDVKTWYNSQSPYQKRQLENIGVGVELLANFVGAGAVQKSAPVIKEGVIKGAQKTGEALGKTGKAITKTPGMIKKGVGTIDEGIEAGVEKLAGKALGSSDGSKELFKATSPSYNTLSKSKDIKGIVNKSKLADESVVEYGYKPKNTTERVTAYKDTMKNLWDDVEKTRGGVATKFNAKELADTIDSEVQKLSVGGVINPAIKSDVDALMKQADYFRKIGEIDIPTLGNQRTLINAMTDWGSTTQFGNTFSNIMKKVAGKIKEREDMIIGGLEGGKVSDKLRKYGALRSMYDDVVKQDIKALRAKGMGIEESFGRIAGISETLGGIAQIALNPKQALPTILSGGSKILLGKVAGKLKDPDYLIKTGYEKLSKTLSPKTIKNGTIRGNITAPNTNLNRATPIGSIAKKEGGKPLINLAQEKAKAGIIPKPIIKPTKVNPLDLSKSKKGFISPKAIGQDLGLIKKEPAKLEGAMSHRPTKNGVGYNIDSEKSAPDFYTHPEYYDFGGKEYKESIQAIKAMHNKPEAEVTIYRASPYSELRKGDWITLSKEKAKMEQGLEKGAKINSFKVKAKDLHFAGDDITEFGYWGEGIKPKTSILNLSQNKKGMINPKAISESVGIRKKVPDELKGLTEEAKKYNSAEEFQHALNNGIVRGGNDRVFFRGEGENFLGDSPIKHFTKSSSRAREYGKVEAYKISDNANIQNDYMKIWDESKKFDTPRKNGWLTKEFHDYMKKLGYDGFYTPKKELIMINPRAYEKINVQKLFKQAKNIG